MFAEQAERFVRDGDLDKALASLEQAVRENPATPEYRVFLFQLLSILGQWDRALTQLGVLQDMDVTMAPLVLLYREAIQSEVYRAKVLAGKCQPLIFGEPAPWIAFLLQSLNALAGGRDAEADGLLKKGLEMAPALSGSVTCVDKKPVRFEWICDSDSRFGPILETIIHGKYYWVPLDRVRLIRIDPPENLRDLVWTPTHFQWTNSGQATGLIHTRYVGSEQSRDSRICLSRLTQWSSPSEDVSHGLGQRTLATDVEDYPLLQVRQIELDTTGG